MQDQLEIDPRGEAVDRLHAATAIYTASPVVGDLLKRINWPARGGRLVDTSAGDGAFVLGALELMNLAPNDEIAADRVRGWEIHPGAVADARERIEAFLIGRKWTQEVAERTARRMVYELDFLADDAPETGFSAIVGNPPYLRLAFLPSYFQALYSTRIPKHARGDILNAFLDKCSEILPADGVIAMVTSDRWVMNLGCRELRASIGRRLGVAHLERLDCSTAFYRPKKRVKGSLPRIHPIAVILESAGENVPALTAEAYPIDGGNAAANASGVTLNDVALVYLAPWLGAKGVFVVDAALAATFKGADLIPAVDVDDIPSDRDVLLKPTRFAIRTAKDTEPTGALARHLKSGFAKGSKRARERGIYWLPPESITIPLRGPRLLVPRIARRLRVIDLPNGVLPFNHNIQIALPGDGVSLDLLRELLSCDESQEWIRGNAPRLENGFFSITVTLLRRMPVPERFLGRITLRKAG